MHVDNSVAHTHAPDETGELRPVFFASRSLTPGERNYSATALEALCCVWAAELFRPYVGYTHFKMKTDHRVLVRLFGQADTKHSVLQRWISRLNSFDFE